MLGSNVPTTGGISAGFVHAQRWGCECVQIYITPSRRWDVPNISEEEIRALKNAQRENKIDCVVAHVPFLVNLASPDALIWQKSVRRLSIEMHRAGQLGIPSLVLHPGSHRNSGDSDGIKRITEGLVSVLSISKDSTTKICLETMAGQGTELGYRFEQIEQILRDVADSRHLSVCFDTCHVFAAGYDIRGYSGYEAVLNEFDEIVGVNHIGVFHLNDSKKGLGQRVDRHATIGEGYLGQEIFHAIVTDDRFVAVPMILEDPDRDNNSPYTLELLRKLRASKLGIPG